MESIGLADMAFVQVPHPMGMLPLEEIRAKADAAFPEIIKAATQWKPEKTTIAGVGKPPYPAERIKFKGTYAQLNKMFEEKRWSLGLPIIPPTPEAVEAMLKGTTRKPDEVVWVVPPRMGQLTVELVATLGVMAGCKPEHMPLLLAIVEALGTPEADWRGATTTTAAASPLIIVNGPIVQELGLTYSTGVLGGEQPANVAIGYFVNLVGDIVGGSLPPDPDKSTHGSRNDLVAMVVAENEKDNPWKESYAVEHGFKPTDSVVTVMAVYPGAANVDHSSVKGEQLLNTLSIAAAADAAGIGSCFTRADKPYGTDNKTKYVFFLLGPEHAATIQKDFPTKKAAEEYIVKHAALPAWAYAPDICTPPKDMKVTPDTLLQRFTTTDQIHIIVTGGPGKQSQVFPGFPTVTKPVSVLVKK